MDFSWSWIYVGVQLKFIFSLSWTSARVGFQLDFSWSWREFPSVGVGFQLELDFSCILIFPRFAFQFKLGFQLEFDFFLSWISVGVEFQFELDFSYSWIPVGWFSWSSIYVGAPFQMKFDSKSSWISARVGFQLDSSLEPVFSWNWTSAVVGFPRSWTPVGVGIHDELVLECSRNPSPNRDRRVGSTGD